LEWQRDFEWRRPRKFFVFGRVRKKQCKGEGSSQFCHASLGAGRSENNSFIAFKISVSLLLMLMISLFVGIDEVLLVVEIINMGMD